MTGCRLCQSASNEWNPAFAVLKGEDAGFMERCFSIDLTLAMTHSGQAAEMFRGSRKMAGKCFVSHETWRGNGRYGMRCS